jgi:hypothetical protein
MNCELEINRSQIASAIVFSPMTSYQFSTGNWLAMSMDFRSLRSSSSSNRLIRDSLSSTSRPKSSRMIRSFFWIFFQLLQVVAARLRILQLVEKPVGTVVPDPVPVHTGLHPDRAGEECLARTR